MTGQLLAVLGFALIVLLERRRYERLETHKRDCERRSHEDGAARVERRKGRWAA